MAQRRMMSKKIIDTDVFLSMPATSQNLYFHFLLRADDDGFIGNPKTIMRMVGASEDDIKVLIAKKFLIPFETGILVIRHWKIHNYIQNDRYQPTQYVAEKEQLSTTENGEYYVTHSESTMYPKCIQNVSKMDTQDSIGKDSIEKNNTVNSMLGTIKHRSEPPPKQDYSSFVNEFFSTLKQQDWYKDLQEAFPDVAADATFARARLWLLANPRRRKKDLKRFLYNWLAKEQDKADRMKMRTSQLSRPPTQPSSVDQVRARLRQLIDSVAKNKTVKEEVQDEEV